MYIYKCTNNSCKEKGVEFRALSTREARLSTGNGVPCKSCDKVPLMVRPASKQDDVYYSLNASFTALAGNPNVRVLLDGVQAKISGFKNDFASITTTQHPYIGVEYAWETVLAVMSRGKNPGEFSAT